MHTISQQYTVCFTQIGLMPRKQTERIQRCNMVAFECSQISRETCQQRDTRWTHSTVMSSVHQHTHTHLLTQTHTRRKDTHTLAASVSVYTCYPTPHTHTPAERAKFPISVQNARQRTRFHRHTTNRAFTVLFWKGLAECWAWWAPSSCNY